MYFLANKQTHQIKKFHGNRLTPQLAFIRKYIIEHLSIYLDLYTIPKKF